MLHLQSLHNKCNLERIHTNQEEEHRLPVQHSMWSVNPHTSYSSWKDGANNSARKSHPSKWTVKKVRYFRHSPYGANTSTVISEGGAAIPTDLSLPYCIIIETFMKHKEQRLHHIVLGWLALYSLQNEGRDMCSVVKWLVLWSMSIV